MHVHFYLCYCRFFFFFTEVKDVNTSSIPANISIPVCIYICLCQHHFHGLLKEGEKKVDHHVIQFSRWVLFIILPGSADCSLPYCHSFHSVLGFIFPLSSVNRDNNREDGNTTREALMPWHVQAHHKAATLHLFIVSVCCYEDNNKVCKWCC